MCLIAYQQANTAPLKPEWMANGWTRNKDGAGYMFVADGKLVIRKPFYKLKDLKTAYAADHKLHGATSPFVVHFRFTTHGSHAEENVHPHVLAGGRAALVHNGMLDQFDPCHKTTISDTVLFCRTVLAMRDPEQLLSEPFNEFLAEMIGDYNKLVLMDDIGNVSIVNSQLGVWVDTDAYWFSNHGYEAASGISIMSRIAGTVSGVARGIVFGDDAKLPSKYKTRSQTLPPMEGELWDDLQNPRDQWEWDQRAADIREDDLDELWALQNEVDHAPNRMTNADWDRYAELCEAYPNDIDEFMDERAEVNDDAWLREKQMSLAMDRDSRD